VDKKRGRRGGVRMCGIPDLGGKSPSEINRLLDDYRRRLNRLVEERCMELIAEGQGGDKRREEVEISKEKIFF
jgi:hypothetical protein